MWKSDGSHFSKLTFTRAEQNNISNYTQPLQ